MRLKPIVLLDVDGPLADFAGGYLDALFAESGRRHHPSEIDRVVSTHAKYLVRGEIFVDDKPSHVTEWSRWNRTHPSGAFLYDMPHNRAEATGAKRAGWAEILEGAKELATNGVKL